MDPTELEGAQEGSLQRCLSRFRGPLAILRTADQAQFPTGILIVMEARYDKCDDRL